jgi:hypothetical protein
MEDKFYDVELDEAAAKMELDPTEIEWAIEEYGRCDSLEWVAWIPEYPDEEYPQAEAPAID